MCVCVCLSLSLALSLLNYIGKGKREEASQIAAAASTWAQNFIRCGNAGLRGFESTRLTPYFHLVATHAASLVGEIGGLDRFSGEKLEKLNDMFKRSHMRLTNWNDIKASIMTHKRREIAFRAESIRKQIQDASREPKHGCQGPYRGFGARVMAQERQQANRDATDAATLHYRDPRSMLTSAELRQEYSNITGGRKFH